VLGVLAAIVLATFVTLLVVSGDGDGEGDRVAAGTSTTSSSSTSTSTSSSTTTSSTTPSSTTPVTTAPPSTTAPPTTVVLPVVTGQGAVLHAPTTAETRVVPPGAGCEALGDAGWTVTCGTAVARGGVLAWVVETMATGDGATARRAMVFRRGTGQQWSLVLRAGDETGKQFAAVRARVEDLSGDGAAEIAFGFTRVGASGVLALDVVEGPGNVVVHRELPKGVARVSSGQLDTWRRTDSTHYAHEVIQFRDGAWRIVASTTVPAGDVPPSQL
jgi:hypothetical protein